MKPILILLALSLAALGQNRLAPAVAKAVQDFERVDAAPLPRIEDTMSCVQSQAAAIPVVRPEERFLYHYRKGYCEILGAAVTSNSERFRAASSDFEAALANWPARLGRPPAGLRAMLAIARIDQGRGVDAFPDTGRELAAIIADPGCGPSPVMSSVFCAALVDTSKIWLGWLAYKRSDFSQASQQFRAIPESPWNAFLAGRVAQDGKRLPEAAGLYQKALETWNAARKSPSPDIVTLLGPPLDLPAVYYQLGLLEFQTQSYDSAISRFDAVIKETPRNSYAIFLRARAKEALKLSGPAIDDYALALQTARANGDSSWALGQAHYARGVLLYRAKDYSRAETEFGAALGSRLTETPQADVMAWRALASARVGDCSTIDALEGVIKAASERFPAAEADELIYDCRLKQATTTDQLIALEKLYAKRLAPAKLRELRNRIAAAYADQGVAAEDRRDSYAAVIAYRQALTWNPQNAKARFNLGAIYIEDKRYNLAEAEYQALVDADASDYEARYWLAQSILAQRPGPDRVAAACVLLKQSLAVSDPQKRAEFGRALAAAKCN